MEADSRKIYQFRKRISELKRISGRGTELISVYISEGYPISEITNKLRDEYGQSANIKSKTTQQNVQSALQKVIQYLKIFGNKAPENGIAIFAGNISETEGKTDIQLFSLIPPYPLQIHLYRCDSSFFLEPLEEMLEVTGTYGIVVMDGKDAIVATLKGKAIKILKKLHSTAMPKFVKGGQSAARFQRIREEEVEVYYKRIGEAMNSFVGMKDFKGVIIGGPGPSKENFLRMKSFHHEMKILGVVDTGYSDEHGIRELLEKSSEIIAEQEAIKEKKLLNDFKKEIARNGLVVYGAEEVRNALLQNKISSLLVSEDFELKEFEYKCGNCGNILKKISENQMSEAFCGECSQRMQAINKKDLIAEIIELAENSNAEIIMVSQETDEGKEFFGAFHGIGAFLRYK